jgi:hypothetical protein
MIPTGLGIGVRPPFVPGLLTTDRSLDFLELVPENVVGRGGRALRDLVALRERWPMLAHGVGLSLGGPDPLDRTYIAALRTLLDTLGIPLYTDHLCYSRLGGLQTHGLLPLPETEEAVHHCAARIRTARDLLDRPVAVENIAQYAIMPGATLSPEAFVTAVCEEADCGLLLDVNNVVVNATNRGTDARADLFALPLHRVVQIHVAGHEVHHGRCLDSHGAPVSARVLELTAELLEHVGRQVPVLLERDLNLPPLDEVLDEADVLRDRLFRREAA